jgi:DNA-binding CsgD family transcriptional regulator
MSVDVLDDIARRYGVAVPAGVAVTRVATGVTSFVLPVWDGKHLVYPDGHWSAQDARAKTKRVKFDTARKAAARARQDRLRALFDGGMVRLPDLAAALEVTPVTVRNDLAAVGLELPPPPRVVRAPKPPKRRVQPAVQQADTIRARYAAGDDLDAIAGAVGCTVAAVAYLLRAELRAALRDRIAALLPDHSLAQIACILGMGKKNMQNTVQRMRREGLLPQQAVGVVRHRPAVADGRMVRAPRVYGPSTKLGVVSDAVLARRARLPELRARGLTVVQIAAELGCSRSVAASDINAMGLAGSREHFIGALPVVRIAVLLQDHSRADIARIAGVSERTLNNRVWLLRKQGVLSRPSRAGGTDGLTAAARRLALRDMYLPLLADHTFAQIGARLGINPHTVCTQVTRLRRAGLLPAHGLALQVAA